MAHPTETRENRLISSHTSDRGIARSVVTLASWRLRRTWGLLLVIGLSIVAEVTMVCVVPLYTQVSMTAGLRQTFTSSYDNADMFVQSSSQLISPRILADASQQIEREFKRRLGPVIGPQEFSLETPGYSRLVPIGKANIHGSFQTTFDQVRFISASINQSRSHFILLQGQLPPDNESYENSSTPLDIALSAYSAKILHAYVGEILYVSIPLSHLNRGVVQYVDIPVPLRIVGIFTLTLPDDPYFHGENFVSTRLAGGEMNPILASTQSLIMWLSALTASLHGSSLKNPLTCAWYYHFDASHMSINDLGPLLNGINMVLNDTTNNFTLDQGLFLQRTQVGLSSDALEQYSTRVTVAQLTVFCLLILPFGLVLFFLSLMIDVLVDRQLDVIALLRSRGASGIQITNTLGAQCLALALLALVVGPLLASFFVRFLVKTLLPLSAQQALDVLSPNPLLSVLEVRWYALAAALIVCAALALALVRTRNLDALSLRREAARPSHRAFWQRWRLDMVIIVLMFVCFMVSLYLTNNGLSDARLRLLLVSPVALLGSVCLLLAGLLIFLRFFPRLLQWGTRLALHSRAAVPLLAWAQMARAPRRAIHLLLLLALATALTVFTLIFTASQAQRVLDVSAYQSGADFSGSFQESVLPLSQVQALYRGISGVDSATVGYTSQLYAGKNWTFPVDIRAVDANTFAQTALWSGQDSSQSLQILMRQLREQRPFAITHNSIPAIVDAITWKTLNLTSNATFIMSTDSEGGAPLHFLALAEVQNIPTISDSDLSTDTGSVLSSGGVLVDYQTYASVYAKENSGQLIPLNYVWIRSDNSPAAIDSVRQALASGSLQLQSLYDRRAIQTLLSNEPLSLTINGVLALGAAIALLLALLGNLITSWLSVRSRLTNFAVLRALGCSPRQLVSILALEQSSIYATALGLGILLGIILAKLTLLSLIFTSVSPNANLPGSDLSAGQFYLLQNVPPVQIVLPPSLEIALAILLLTCLIALVLMVYIISQRSLSQALRLNED